MRSRLKIPTLGAVGRIHRPVKPCTTVHLRGQEHVAAPKSVETQLTQAANLPRGPWSLHVCRLLIECTTGRFPGRPLIPDNPVAPVAPLSPVSPFRPTRPVYPDAPVFPAAESKASSVL